MDNRTRLKNWLKLQRLIADPFATYKAEEEGDHLPLVWVDRPHFWPVMGSTSHPRPTFLFAGRGDGKSATRAMVQYECTKSLRGEALAVSFLEYSRLLEQTDRKLETLTARQMVGEIIRSILKTLTEDAIPVDCFKNLDQEQRDILTAYCQEFSTGFSRARLLKIFKGSAIDVDWLELSPLEMLSTLTGILTNLAPFPGKKEPLKAIFLLIDRLDETGLGQEAAIDILRPIVRDGPLLETPCVSFKFFLPLEIEARMMQELSIRQDRVEIEHIEWSRVALEKMVNQRLMNFSEGNVTHFRNLCKETARVKGLERLLTACEGSPRALLQMCSDVLIEHVSRSQDSLIDLDTIADVIIKHRFEKETALAAMERTAFPSAASTYGAAASSGAPSTSAQGIEPQREYAQEVPMVGLYMMQQGQVWVDGAKIEPPLSSKEFTLLWTLYRNGQSILSVDALIEAVWGGNEGARTEQNLRKLIARVREKLEPQNSSAENSRFIKNSKGRGYYLLRQ